jgi:hypothetical protein
VYSISTICGGKYVSILYFFNAFYSGWNNVAVVIIGISVVQLYLKRTYPDTEEAHRRAGLMDNTGSTISMKKKSSHRDPFAAASYVLRENLCAFPTCVALVNSANNLT